MTWDPAILHAEVAREFGQAQTHALDEYETELSDWAHNRSEVEREAKRENYTRKKLSDPSSIRDKNKRSWETYLESLKLDPVKYLDRLKSERQRRIRAEVRRIEERGQLRVLGEVWR